MANLILLCTLAALIGLALGYWLGWAWDAVNRKVDSILSGYTVWCFVNSPEVWR